MTIEDLTTSATLSLRQGTPYLLISANSDTDYSGVVTELNGVLGYWDGYVVGVGTDTAGGFVPITINQVDSSDNSLVAGSTVYPDAQLYLYQGDLEIVPEPETGVLALGGLTVLAYYQRRRKV